MAVAFFVNGIVMANWVARVPAVKDHVEAGPGSLGIALLGIAAGSMVTLPISGKLCDRYESRRVVTASGLALAVSLFLVALAPSVVVLGLSLVLLGAFFGLLDVAMNVQAVAVIRLVDRPIMPLFHAGFSAGGLVGAATGGLAAHLGLTPVVHFGIVAVATGLAIVAVRPLLLPDPPNVPRPSPDGDGVGPRRRSRLPLPIVGLGLVGLCAALCEGAMADWTALFLRDVRGLDPGTAALGFAAFSVTMTAGRLGGTAAIAWLGPVRVVRLGGLIGAAGIVTAVGVESPAAAVVGFGLVGVGMCCAYPLALSTAGESSDGTGGPEIAAVSVIGYAGFLVGPPTVGLLAEGTGLRNAMLVLVVPALALVALAPLVRPRVSPAATAEPEPLSPPAAR